MEELNNLRVNIKATAGNPGEAMSAYGSNVHPVRQ
jgi:hypothetical protein